jgi:hypothetical protein
MDVAGTQWLCVNVLWLAMGPVQTIRKKIAKLARRHIGTKPCPEIRWDDVVRIEATGTDAFGAFEVWLTIYQSDGSEVTLTVDHKGYDKILESLPERFPSIRPDWYDQMAEQPWHVESALYAR